MNKSDFGYLLPQELIAQQPASPRDTSRLLVMNRHSGELKDSVFNRLTEYLKAGDCLILNDSRVLPARLYGEKADTGGAVELLLLHEKGQGKKDGNSGVCQWEVLAGPGKRAKQGNLLTFSEGLLKAKVLSILDDGNRLVEFRYEGNFYKLLERIGEMPLPHYITRRLEDGEKYQTVYSRNLGSAAAPTAGLHFTPELLDSIHQKGVNIGFVTLHVGLGTFRPVKVDDITHHHMHSEHYDMSPETADLINSTRKGGGRVIAVGTTSCRTIESVASEDGQVKPGDGWTSIFIYPGYRFKVLDGLVTNFHLPESTLIMLVCAFAGYDKAMAAYEHAVLNRYRFFSFGDAMLIL